MGYAPSPLAGEGWDGGEQQSLTPHLYPPYKGRCFTGSHVFAPSSPPAGARETKAAAPVLSRKKPYPRKPVSSPHKGGGGEKGRPTPPRPYAGAYAASGRGRGEGQAEPGKAYTVARLLYADLKTARAQHGGLSIHLTKQVTPWRPVLPTVVTPARFPPSRGDLERYTSGDSG